ncbi:ATP-dependent helicase dcl1 [Rhizodiscina lignyota]|uniref:Dicer-like protein 1 n=1 Tax=Rhizodiscina lignyota TaxID=1504668 RepID=A0A9P4MF89_9PEZI|nr:ATP-dependent helicase dcl1 [Rhizodiscina lignyota]
MALTEEEVYKTDLDDDNDAEHDSEDDSPQSAVLRPISARKREQRAIFQDYVTKRAQNITKEEIKQELQNADDEELSIKALMAKHENEQITTPREYQLELFERAKQQNIIAVLDTGSGKTHISVLLLRHVIDQELEGRAAGKPPKISFFLVDSVALVMQQHAVLSCNLNQNVDRIHGAMVPQLWSREKWEGYFAENMVLVCTAEVVCHALAHSFINIEQINLLIFDEAHHAKKEHPYARIIRDHYLPREDKTKLPKIFGMTASPVDVKADDIGGAAMELEHLLQCRIATTSDLSLLQKFVSRPEEKVTEYPALQAPFETPFHQELKTRFGDLNVFRKYFSTSKVTAAELGPWASDFYWTSALADAQASKKRRKIERDFNKTPSETETRELDQQLAKLEEATELVRNHDFGDPTPITVQLSPKVVKLHEWLLQYFSHPSSTARCIVFVERRHTAHLLCEIFTRIGGQYLKSGMLTGTNRGDEISVTFRQQMISLQRFRSGEVNCLFATSIAEEGLDIPACNLVVRFDLYKTMIQYIQSRGRARHRHSQYLHMIEHGNSNHDVLVHNVLQSEKIMRRFCETLPEDRRLEGNDDIDESQLGANIGRTYTEPTTGAKLTYHSSLAVLAHFVSSLPSEGDEPLTPNYVVTAEAGNFICEVILPECSPVQRTIGRPERRKALAKRSAAFDLCIQLRKGKFLNQNLLPIYTKQLPAMRNAQLAMSSKKSSSYEMQSKPKLWELGRGEIPNRLYLTILDVSEGLERPQSPIGLVTRYPLPDIPRFPLFLTSGKITGTVTRTLELPFEVSPETIRNFTTFTHCAWLDIWNKTYEFDPANMSYWIVPLLPSAKGMAPTIADITADKLIDCEAILHVVETDEYIRWMPDMSHESLENRFFVDPWDGGRRWFSSRVVETMRAGDTLPVDAERDSAKARGIECVLDYSNSLWKKSRAKVKHAWDPNQPVLLAEFREVRQDFLGESSKPEKEKLTKAFICPQPLRISRLNPSFVAMCLVLPSIIHRIESYMIALEAFDVLGLKVEAPLALEAMTKDSDNSGEHDEERINFQRGMGNNYERLEFLGDCFLKMATTIPLFARNPTNNEEQFHIKRMIMICNQNLFTSAKKLEVFKFVRSKALSRYGWYPEGLKLLKGKGLKRKAEQDSTHALSDKTVADVCEAAIGASFLQYNVQGVWNPDSWQNAITAVTNLVQNSDHTAKKWSDYYELYSVPEFHHTNATAAQLNMAAQIEQAHCYHFNFPKLLRSAFMHPSRSTQIEKIPSYQRLEFLGDALLDLACVTHLFYNYPTKDPQWLTEHKTAMVSNRFLGAVCVKLGFHHHLVHDYSSIENSITSYVLEATEAEADSNGSPDYWTSIKEAPKCLPDIVESYIGAIFVDSGFNYGEVQRFFDEHIKRYFEDMTIYDTFASNHPITRLHHLLAIDFGCHDHSIMSQTVPPLAEGMTPKIIAGFLVHGQVITDDVGDSGRYAKERASKKALVMLRALAPSQFRRKYGCDCKVADDEETEVEGPDLGTAI